MFRAPTYTRNWIFNDESVLFSSYKKKAYIWAQDPLVSDNIFFRMLPSREGTQKLPKVSFFYLHGKLENYWWVSFKYEKKNYIQASDHPVSDNFY